MRELMSKRGWSCQIRYFDCQCKRVTIHSHQQEPMAVKCTCSSVLGTAGGANKQRHKSWIIDGFSNQEGGKLPLTENCPAEINWVKTTVKMIFFCWCPRKSPSSLRRGCGCVCVSMFLSHSQPQLLENTQICNNSCPIRTFSHTNTWWQTCNVQYIIHTHVSHLPFDGALGTNVFFSSALGAEFTPVEGALLLAGVSYTYEPAPPMFTPAS